MNFRAYLYAFQVLSAALVFAALVLSRRKTMHAAKRQRRSSRYHAVEMYFHRSGIAHVLSSLSFMHDGPRRAGPAPRELRPGHIFSLRYALEKVNMLSFRAEDSMDPIDYILI